MRIKTNYDCTFEEKDMMHLAKGRQLAATLSDGSVAFRFNLDPELLQHGPKRLVKGIVVDEPANGNGNGHRPLQLTDGKKKYKSYTHKGKCPYCAKDQVHLEPHIRQYHPGKNIHPDGKFRCSKCIQRFLTANGLIRHTRFMHSKDSAKIRKLMGGPRKPTTVAPE